MNKIAIPAILVATVMVAGMFAFMPVEQASTVHDTLEASLGTQQAVLGVIAADADGASTTTLTCDAPFEVTQITVQTIGTVDAVEDVDVDFDLDGAGGNWTADTDYINDVNVSDDENTILLSNEDFGFLGSIIGTTDGTVTVTLNAVADGDEDDDDDEGLRVMFMVKSGGTCSTS